MGRTWTSVLAMLCIATAGAQQAPDYGKAEIKSEKLTDNLYMLSSTGVIAGNVAVLVGANGVLLVDDQFTPLVPKITQAIAAVSSAPVRFVLNTHWHDDHTGGNEPLGKAGAVIIAHDNTLKRVSTDQFIALFNTKTPAKPPQAWPLVTFADSVSLHLNGEDIEAVHVANAHTDSDIIVYFKKANVAHTGDVFPGPAYPFIDTSSGGSLDGVIAAAATILSRIDDNVRIIPGHADMQKKADLAAWRGMLITVRSRVSEAIRAGNTQEQVVAAGVTKEFDAKYGKGFIDPTVFVQRAYVDLKRTVK
jgi:glyoxylase-like metal-dependent hydrolase (beta-lactamase superfamily II)